MDESTQRGASRETLIAEALAAVFTMLDEAESPPQSREFRSRARFYDRTIKHRTVVPPTFALVVELHGRTVAAQRTRST